MNMAKVGSKAPARKYIQGEGVTEVDVISMSLVRSMAEYQGVQMQRLVKVHNYR